MKLKPTLFKLPLIALLSIGLAGSPLLVNADDGNRGWHGHNRQDQGKSHYKAGTRTRSDHHDRVYHKTHGHRDRCRVDFKHGHKKGHHKYRPHHRGRHYNITQPYYRDGYHHDSSLYYPGSLFSSLSVLFYD
jgi:hypothetical protein